METLTHLAIGGLIGSAFSANKHTKRFMITGAIIQVVPDLDVVAGLWMEPAEAMLAHRGFSHSILFAVLFSLFVSSWLPHSKLLDRSVSFWLLFSFLQLLVHDVLDVFNVYGTALFMPFSDERISFHSVFVADPIFTLGPLLGILWMIWFRNNLSLRIIVPFLAFLWCTTYLLISVSLKKTMEEQIQSGAAFHTINHQRLLVTPTPFNNLLWFVMVEEQKGFHLGYRSVFQKTGDTRFRFIPKQDSLIEPIKNRSDLRMLKNFSDGFYVVQNKSGNLYFSDLRFGLKTVDLFGSSTTDDLPVFQYGLKKNQASRNMLQRGRFSGFTLNEFKKMYRMIFYPQQIEDESQVAQE